MKRKTWILVANRADAKIFLHEAVGAGISQIEHFENPEGKLKAVDLTSDRQGSSYDSNPSSHHNSYSTPVDPRKHVLERFAREVAESLNRSAYQGKFERLVIVAEPSMLGELRSFLDKHSTEKIVATSDKDLVAFDARDIPEHLSTLVTL